MKCPLVPLALAYTAGVLLGTAWNPGLFWLYGLACCFLVSALAWSSQRHRLLWPLLLVAGWANLVSQMAVVSPLDLRLSFGERVELVTLRGRLQDTPSVRVFTRAQEPVSRHTLAFIETQAVCRGQEWQPALGLVVVRTPGVLAPEFFGGRLVEITGVIQPPPGALADGLFDYRAYLRWLGVYHLVRCSRTNDWRIVPSTGQRVNPPLTDRFLNWAQRTLACGLPEEDEALRLLWAMTLGWKTALTDEASEPFMRTGTMHIFAISGLHIVLIAGILVRLLRVFRLPRSACGAIAIPLFWFYTLATGWQASAIRSAVMMTLVVGGWMLRRPGELINSLAAAGFIILCWDPRQLFQAGFQLSFFVVLSIALFLPPLEQLWTRLAAPDPWLPPGVVSQPRHWLVDPFRYLCRHRWFGDPVRWLALSVATSVAAWLGSLPLIAWYFHLATPVNLLANLVVVPLSSLALMSNLGALVCGPWLPYFTEWFNHSAWLWMKCMVGVSEWAARLPGAFRAVPTPAPWFCALYYGVLLGAFRGWFWQPRYRRWAAAILLLGVGLCVGPWISTRHELRFTVLALDHGGSAAFLDAPGRHRDLLIDTGRDSDAQRIVKPFLMAQGVNQLARLVLTHGDIGHLGGAELIRAELGASQVITSTVRYRSPVYRALTNQLVQTPGQWLRVQRGDQVAGWRVLHPPTGARLPRADDLPLVLLVEWQGNRLLLLSDLSPEGQAELLKGNEDLHADLVVSSLPLQGEPLGEVLLEAIRPRAMIVNDALYRPNERARLALRERLARRRVPVLYTSEVGAVTVLLDRGGWQLGSMRGPTVRSDRPKPAWQAAEYPPLGPPLDDGTPDEDAPEEPPQS